MNASIFSRRLATVKVRACVIGLVVIDIVTERHWNLHNELVRIAEHDDKFLMADDPRIYITAYRPVSRNREDLVDLWRWPLKVGEPPRLCLSR